MKKWAIWLLATVAVACFFGNMVPKRVAAQGIQNPCLLYTCGNPYHLLSAANTNSTLVATGPHALGSVVAINSTSTIYYLRFYDSAAAPTCSSATGVVLNIPVPAATAGAGVAVAPSMFAAFNSGLSFCLTGASGDNDNTNAATGVTINLIYR